MALSFSIFIISWKGQHHSAENIAGKLARFGDHLSVVYSDPDPDVAPNVSCQLIRRSNDLFFGDKFKACLDAATGDLLIMLHSDCTCDDWEGLVRRCIEVHEGNSRIAMWTPYTINSGWPLEKVRIASLPKHNLSIVAQTDCICLSFSRPIIDRLRQVNYDSNTFGWGIDWLMICYAFSHNLLAVVDESVSVRHSLHRSYDTSTAWKQMHAFMEQFTTMEKVLYRVLLSYCKRFDQHTRPKSSATLPQ